MDYMMDLSHRLQGAQKQKHSVFRVVLTVIWHF